LPECGSTQPRASVLEAPSCLFQGGGDMLELVRTRSRRDQRRSVPCRPEDASHRSDKVVAQSNGRSQESGSPPGGADSTTSHKERSASPRAPVRRAASERHWPALIVPVGPSPVWQMRGTARPGCDSCPDWLRPRQRFGSGGSGQPQAGIWQSAMHTQAIRS
jgi:hypothetical protein